MKITPLDIQQKRFSRAMRGYDQEEVEAFLSLVASGFEDLVKELHGLREDLARRDEDIAAHRDLEKALQETLVTAQRASDEIRESARREGEITIGEAELQAEKIVQGAHHRFLRIVDDIQEMKRLRVQFEASVRSLVEGHAKLLDTFQDSDVRADIIRAKTQFIERDGLKFGVRTVEDVERIGKLCGALPNLANRLLRSDLAGGMIKEALGIHRDRKLPEFSGESFPAWARRKGLNVRPNTTAGRKVAYFAGCTARHIFPGVARATVEVLQHNGIDVYCPDHKCCGMPSFLEGDRKLTMEFAGHNLNLLADTAQDGYDIVCSCPTCSFMLRHLLAEGAYYSREYQESAGADPKFIKVPAKPKPGESPEIKIETFDKTIFKNIMKDQGYFSSLAPMKRVAVAEKIFDVGEYLLRLHKSGELKTNFAPVHGQTVYFPPCHQREQEFGQPYMELLGLVPGLKLDAIQGNLYCCGLAGVMGFKRDFHEASIELGSRLIGKIREMNPEILVTDCLSCRLQFNQLLPLKVLHPVEILREAYREGRRVHGSGRTGKNNSGDQPPGHRLCPAG